MAEIELTTFKQLLGEREKITQILKYVHAHPLFGKSQPGFTYEYIKKLNMKGYGLDDIYDKLLKMDLYWTDSSRRKTRKDWRKVLVDQLIRLEQYRNYKEKAKALDGKRKTAPAPYQEPKSCKRCGKDKEESELMLGGVCIDCYTSKP